MDNNLSPNPTGLFHHTICQFVAFSVRCSDGVVVTSLTMRDSHKRKQNIGQRSAFETKKTNVVLDDTLDGPEQPPTRGDSYITTGRHR
jgi:hypothetical protein